MLHVLDCFFCFFKSLRLELRKISDSICAERNKSVVEGHKFFSNKKEYWIQKSGKQTHRDMLRRDIDEALEVTTNSKSFEYYLQTLGYRFVRDFRYDHPSIIADGWQRVVRIDKLGERFTKENIWERLVKNQSNPELYAANYPNYKRKPLLLLEFQIRQYERKDTVQLLFELFIELLKICTGNNVQQSENRPLSPTMRAEVKKLDKYLEDYKLLCDNKIETAEQLAYLSSSGGVSLASDAFFPFPDNIIRACRSGVEYIAEPGGSMRDDLVIASADDHDAVMMFTGHRLFHH